MQIRRHNPLKPAPAQSNTATIEAPAPAPATKPGGLKKVSLGGIAKKKEDSSSKYPVYPDPDGTAAQIAARICERQEQFDALESALKTDKEELGRVLVRPFYLRHFHNKVDPASSVLVQYSVPEDKENGTPARDGAVRVTVKEQYYTFPDESDFRQILGDDVEKYFRQSFTLKIDGDKLPSDHAGEMVEKLQALFAEYGCSDALEASECILPVDNFRSLRFNQMPLEQSLALENAGEKGLTMVTVSTKGVR